MLLGNQVVQKILRLYEKTLGQVQKIHNFIPWEREKSPGKVLECRFEILESSPWNILQTIINILFIFQFFEKLNICLS